MKITIYIHAKIKDKGLAELLDYYLDISNRKQKNLRLELKTLRDKSPEKPISVESFLAETGMDIQNTLFLAEWGKAYDTFEFCKLVDSYYQQSENINLIIGNAWGWEKQDRDLSGIKYLSLSKMIFNHELAAIMLAEQLYRFADQLSGGKYTK